MSGLQLLMEALQRVYCMLSEVDHKHYSEIFAPYLQGHSVQYIYLIKNKEATKEHLQRIGKVICHLLDGLESDYAKKSAYQVLQLFFIDNFHLEGA
jgi:hypothetical protein